MCRPFAPPDEVTSLSAQHSGFSSDCCSPFSSDCNNRDSEKGVSFVRKRGSEYLLIKTVCGLCRALFRRGEEMEL
jgi:hypothetical protein